MPLAAPALTTSGIAGAKSSPSPAAPIDLASLPGDASATIVIRDSGSYFASRHLRGSRGRHGIRIEAPDVSIDLRGHALLGCEFSADGIVVSQPTTLVRICNGSVRGWTGIGLDLAEAIRAEVENLKVFDNRCGALRLGAAAAMRDCVIGGDILTGAAAFA